MGDKEKQEEQARKEAEKLAKEKAKQEEVEWKEAERLSKERAKQEEKEAEAARKDAERQAKEKAKKEEQARKEAEKLAKEKAKQEEKAGKETEPLSKEIIVEEQPAAADKAESEEAQRLAADKKNKEKEPVDAVLIEGRVRLVIESPVDLGQLAQMQASLHQVEGLQLVMVGGSAGAAHIIVSVEKPLPLFVILEAFPIIESVVKKGKEIRVTLKAG